MDGLSDSIFRSMIKNSKNTAIKIKKLAVTYEELNNFAITIGSFLAGNNIKSCNIGILGQRSLSAYIGILGSIYAGCTYVPVNTKLSGKKILEIIKSANISILIGGIEEWEIVREIILKSGSIKCLIVPEDVLLIEKNIKIVTKNDFKNITKIKEPVQAQPDDNAYIMFTSGSTGAPKGVQVTNSNLVQFLKNMSAFYNLKPGFISAQTCDLSFDFSVFQVFFPLVNGGCICVLPEDEMYFPADFIRRENINIWSSVPTLAEFMRKLGGLKPNCFPELKYSIFCGEPLTQIVANAWHEAAPESTVENFYGPTETTVFISRYLHTEKDIHRIYNNNIVPIGKFFKGQKVALIDENNSIITNNGIGEIIISGSQVTKGYLNDPEKNFCSFIKMDWDEENNLWYRTGDLSFYNENGDLEYVSRKDNQIKISGRRIEIGEIEACLKGNSKIDDIIIVPARDSSGIVQYLAAYVPIPVSDDDVNKLRNSVEGQIESVFFPKKFIFIEQIPTTINGKIDRSLLEKKLYLNC